MAKWISVKEKLPDDLQEVIITFVNHKPESYYAFIKDIPMVGAGVFFEGRWYWYSAITQDVLKECGEYPSEMIDGAVEVTNWMPLPKPSGGPEDV